MGQVCISTLFLLIFHVVETVIEGYITGLAMIVFIGPVFFTLIQSTLQYGAKTGLAVTLGIFISDAVIATLCLFGAMEFFENKQYQTWLALAGGLILFFIGFKYILRPTINTVPDFKLSVFSLSTFFAKGFLVNFVNPFVFMVWISITALAKIRFDTWNESMYFLGAALIGILTTDSLKVILAERLQKFLHPVVLRKIFFVTGLILLCFGIRFLYFAFMQ